MCISPLDIEYLKNMEKFKYSSTDDSLLYNKCMSPCLNKVVEFLPRKLAPNLITLFSLCCNIIAATCTYMDAGLDYSKKLHPITCVVMGGTQFLYQILDNLDGKQARRTGTSSPFGMLLDHGCDIFTNILTSFNMTHLFLLGNDGFLSLSCIYGLMIGFYIMTYEEYIMGAMHFAMINGADEGNLLLSAFEIACGFIGQEWLEYDILEDFSVGQCFGLILFIASLSCCLNCFIHVCGRYGVKKMCHIWLDLHLFYFVIIFPLIFMYFKREFYRLYGWIVMAISCILFARETNEIQINIVGNIPLKGSIYLYIMNILVLVAFFIPNIIHCFYFLLFIATIAALELGIFMIKRANQITHFLGIHIFTIEPKMPNTSSTQDSVNRYQPAPMNALNINNEYQNI